MSDDKIAKLVKELAELRKELVARDPCEEGLTLTLSGQDLGAVVYALSLAYVTEWMNAQDGYRKLMSHIGEASATILWADEGPKLDRFIDEVLGGEDAAA